MEKNSINFDITAYSSSGKEFEEITYIQNRDDLDTHYDIALLQIRLLSIWKH